MFPVPGTSHAQQTLASKHGGDMFRCSAAAFSTCKIQRICEGALRRIHFTPRRQLLFWLNRSSPFPAPIPSCRGGDLGGGRKEGGWVRGCPGVSNDVRLRECRGVEPLGAAFCARLGATETRARQYQGRRGGTYLPFSSIEMLGLFGRVVGGEGSYPHSLASSRILHKSETTKA